MLHALQSKTDDRGDTAQEDNEHQHAAPFYGLRLRDVSLEVEPRQWVYGTSLIRGMLSVPGGSGGEGKSAYSMTVLVSIATGRPLLAAAKDDPAHRIYEPRGTVMYLQPRRPDVRFDPAGQRHHATPQHQLALDLDWPHLAIGTYTFPLVVAKQDERGKLIRCDIQPIVDYLVANNVVALTVDPVRQQLRWRRWCGVGHQTP